MKNIIDYALGTAGAGFDIKPMCEADSLVLSQLSYMDFSGEVPGPAEKAKPVTLRDAILYKGIRALCKDTIFPEKNEKLLQAVLDSSRFGGLKLKSFVNEVDDEERKQFAAITYVLPDRQAYIAFRGTDTTLTGWREDFNMAFTYPVPAQQDAAAYLDAAGKANAGTLFVGGHSKGGNLAIYASVRCEQKVRVRIAGIFNHDGPGFKEDIYSEEGFKQIESLVRTSLPTHSVVGILLQHDDNYRAVKSNAVGLLQHDPFTWSIKGGDLEFTDGLNSQSVFLDKTIGTWLAGLADDERKKFVDALFEIADASDFETIQDVRKNWRKAASDSLSVIKDMGPETRKMATEVFGMFERTVSTGLAREIKGLFSRKSAAVKDTD